MVPSKISAFGVEIGATRAIVLVLLAWLVCLYFLAAFFFHHRSDRFATEAELTRYEIESSDEFFVKLKEMLTALEEGGKTHRAVREAIRGSIRKHIRQRYEFDFCSAVGISGIALIGGGIWLFMMATIHC